jgi:hypothetical protein
MQAVEAAGSQEPRNGIRAAFDENAAQAALRQGSKDCRRSDLAAGLRQSHDLDALRQRRPHAAAAQHDTSHPVVGEEPGARRQASGGVNHHANRMRA